MVCDGSQPTLIVTRESISSLILRKNRLFRARTGLCPDPTGIPSRDNGPHRCHRHHRRMGL
jgi:hypothetical protein